VHFQGHDITNATPRTITELGSAHVPEDRQRDGLVLSFPVADNLVLNMYYQPPFAQGPVLQEETILENAEKLIRDFDIRTPSPMTPAGSLSGGNQQKVIVAREFSRPIKLLVASQPTRGLDVGSVEYIHGRIIEQRDNGCAVLLVSSELDEIMQLSDRIAVMYRGKIVAIVPSGSATKEGIGLLMAGVQPENVF
jgi:simple sugar transport system ATP-binding protein